MALIKCPDCGKMVSDKAVACPDCGCPTKFFSKEDRKEEMKEAEKKEEIQIISQEENKQTEEIDEKIVFQFAGERFEYSKHDSYYIKVIGQYLVMAEMINYMAGVAYDKLDGIGEVLRNFPTTMNNFLQENIYNITTECLYRLGDSLSIEQFIRKYNDRYNMQYEVYYSKVVEQYVEIRQDAARLAEYRSAVKNSRARWVGGGFGVKGAVKGAVTAGLLNCGSDLLHSFGDAADERRDNQEIQKKLQGLYRNPDTINRLAGGMRTCVLNIMYALQDEVESIGAVSSKIEINREKAFALYSNTLKWENEDETFYKNMAKCISYYPVMPAFYNKLEPAIIACEEKDISSFIEFWGFCDILSDFTNLKNKEIDFDKWDLKCTLETLYENYKKYLPSEKVEDEKHKALVQREHRETDKIHLADNIRRRLGSLLNNIECSEDIINTFLYLMRSEFWPTSLMRTQETDQYIFFDNKEVVVTDYNFILVTDIIPLDSINEIWYGEANQDGIFSIQIFLKNHQGSIDGRGRKSSTIDILTLLNIALEPYREIDYMTAFQSKMLDMFIALHNSEEILALDNDEDKANRKKIETENIRCKAEHVKLTRLEQWSEEERELAASIKRRFQALLELCSKNLDCENHIVNRFLYEMEIENILIPSVIRSGDCGSDEFIFYADDVCAVTDYRFCIVGGKEDSFSCKLKDVNEIYFSKYSTCMITRKDGLHSKEIEIDQKEKYFKPEILFFLNIALEPYREIAYIPEIQNGEMDDYPLSFLREFEEKHGDFGKYITEKLDNEVDWEKRRIIKSEVERRAESRKMAAKSYREEHLNPVRDKFANAFTDLYIYLYAKCEEEKGELKDIKYLTGYRNRFDYEIYECLPKKMKELLDNMPEKGQRILWSGDDILLTDWNINIEGNVFPLYELKEISTGMTIQADEADSYYDWIDSDMRYVIEFRNGSIQILKSEHYVLNSKVWFPLNYTLKILHNLDAENHFLQEKSYFCKNCNSFHITEENGFLGKKYRCMNCNNKNKKKILLLDNNQDTVISFQEVSTYILYNKLDTQFEPIVEQHALPIQQPPSQPPSIQQPPSQPPSIQEPPSQTPSIRELPSQISPMQELHPQVSPIQESQTQVPLMRELMLCKNCGKKMAAGVKYCSYCGQLIEQNAEIKKMIFCVYCGSQILNGIKFCNYCGNPNTYRKNEVEKNEV